MARRGHELLPHTADAGFRAHAETLPALFEEAALALAGLSADVDPGCMPDQFEGVTLDADDLTGLAYGWLNELIGLAEVHRGVVIGAEVHELQESAAGSGGWILRARVGLCRHDRSSVRDLRQVKSATYHRLCVEQRRRGWLMEAYVDI